MLLRRNNLQALSQLSLSLGLIIATIQTGRCDPIYKSVDRHGSPLYTSNPSKSKDRHELPEIMKTTEDPLVKRTAIGQCSSHDGVDCDLGADADGSVICKDGYRDTRALFKYTCPTARLVVASINQAEGSPSVTVVVRNTRPTTAVQPVFRLLSQSNPPLEQRGPAELGGQGIGTYDVHIPQKSLPGGSRTPTKNQLLVTCANCG